MKGIIAIFKIIFWAFRSFRTLLIVGLITLNIATLTVTGVFASASAALSSLGVTTVAAREASQNLARRNATRKIGQETAQKVRRRVQRGTVRSIASVGGEAVPVIGIAVIASALVLEVKDACDTAADMAGLEAALTAEGDTETARQAAIDHFDCKAMIREEMPDYDSLPSKEDIWASVKSSPSRAYDKAKEAGTAVMEVEWSGAAGTAVNWALNRAEYFADWFKNDMAEPAE